MLSASSPSRSSSSSAARATCSRERRERGSGLGAVVGCELTENSVRCTVQCTRWGGRCAVRAKLQVTAAVSAGVAAVGAGALGVVGLSGSAFATTGQRADFVLGFDSARPATKVALVLHVVYKAAGDPDATPSPIRKVVIAAPEGTRFDTTAVPPCKASDD